MSNDQASRWSAAASALFSLRIHWMGAVAAFISSLLVGFLLGLIGFQWLAERAIWFVGFPVWALIVLLSINAAYAGSNPMYCHACGKRVKMNFTRCHHCGHEHATASRLPTAPVAGRPTNPPQGPSAPRSPAVLPASPVVPGVPDGSATSGGGPLSRRIERAEKQRIELAAASGAPVEQEFRFATPEESMVPEQRDRVDAWSRRVELSLPPQDAFRLVCDAVERIGKLKDVNDVVLSLTAKLRYGAAPIKLHISFLSGAQPGTAIAEIAVRGGDVWGVSARKVTEKLLAELRRAGASPP
jgi:hypothetical protein